MRVFVLGALLAIGLTSGAAADNNTCLQSGGAWKATGTIKLIVEYQGFYAIELTSEVAASPPDVKSALQPVITGECMVAWAAGEGELGACEEGTSVTISGPISFDDNQVAGIQVREISCQ